MRMTALDRWYDYMKSHDHKALWDLLHPDAVVVTRGGDRLSAAGWRFALDATSTASAVVWRRPARPARCQVDAIVPG